MLVQAISGLVRYTRLYLVRSG